MSEQIRREFTLPFPVSRIKTAIKDACRTSPGGRQLKDYNEAFGTFSVTLVRNLYVLPTTITLKAVSENETHFELSAIPGQHLSRMGTFTSSMIEDFLKQIGDFASGKLVVQVPCPRAPLTPEEERAANKRAAKGWVVLILILGAVGYGIYWLTRH